MTPEQITVAIIVFELLMTSVVFWKTWINFRAKEKGLDHKIEKEKSMLEVLRKAQLEQRLRQ